MEASESEVSAAPGFSLSMASVALAAEPVKVSGDISVKYERDTFEGIPSDSGTMYSVKLMGEAELGSDWTLYARLGAQHATNPLFADFNTDAYAADKKTVVALDQFGLIYKADDFTYKLGRQDVAVGATALLYSRPESNIGKKQFVNGITVSGTSGVTDLSLVAAREDNVVGNSNNKLYAIRAGYSPRENLSLGLTLGRYSSEESTNHWAVDGTYKLGKSSLTAEHTKSSSSDSNKAYTMTLNYNFNDKTSTYITGFRVEANGSMGGQSDFDADNHGTFYGISHKMTDAASLEVVYKDQKTIGTGEKNTKFEATINYTF